MQLLENVQLRPGAKVRLHDVSIPYSWRTIETNVNDHLYLEEHPTVASSSFRRLTLFAGQYDGRALASALQTLFNAGSPVPWGANPYTITYSDQTGSITIGLSAAASGYWVLWDDLSVMNSPTWSAYSVQQPASYQPQPAHLRQDGLQQRPHVGQ